MGYWLLTGLLLVPMLALAGLSLASRKAPQLGIVEGRLLPCPGTPNCISSEEAGATSFTDPLPAHGSPERAWLNVKEAMRQAGGAILKEGESYLWATFTTPLLRFTDDVELRYDARQDVIHIRSASRVGRSDFGTNRKRVERIKDLYCRISEKPCP